MKQFDPIANNIRLIRLLRNMKQEEVAKELGMCKTNYSNYENGSYKISEEILEQLAKVFNTSKEFIKDFNAQRIFENVTHSQIAHSVNEQNMNFDMKGDDKSLSNEISEIKLMLANLLMKLSEKV